MINIISFRDFLDNMFKKDKVLKAEGVVINFPAQLYYKTMALYTAVTLLSNAISKCEIQVYKKHKQVKDNDYYLLNVSPNANESSSQFWHKVIEKMIMEREPPLVVEIGGNLYCADSYGIFAERTIQGNIYENVQIGQLTLNRKFNATDVYIFYLHNQRLAEIVTGLWDDYGRILSSASDALRRSNGRKYKIHIEGAKEGDDEFNKEFEEIVQKQLEKYMSSDNAVYPEFDGYDLQPEKDQPNKSATDFISLRKDMFDMVAAALQIPTELMRGEAKDMDGVTDVFLTFGVDPIADMISEVLTKRGGYDNWKAGNYYVVKTSNIFHRDVFKLADKIDKLIGSGFASPDEARKEAGWEETGEPWAKEHYMTKNYEIANNMVNQIGERGETGDTGKE